LVVASHKLYDDALKECALFSTYAYYRDTARIIDYLRQYKYASFEILNQIYSVSDLCYKDAFFELPEELLNIYVKYLYHYTKYYLSSDITRIIFNSDKAAEQTKGLLSNYGITTKIWSGNKLFVDWENKKRFNQLIYQI
jgi:hypothetical protein